MTTPEASRRPGCVVCGKPVMPATDPFCSQGCRDRDLLQWLSEGHRIPGPVIDEEGEDGAASGLDRGADQP